MTEIVPGIWVGRSGSAAERASRGINSVVVVAPELPSRNAAFECRTVPMLDLVAPDEEQLDSAVMAIDALERDRPTLISCALGYSRSAAAAAAWLCASGSAGSVDAAIALIEVRRRVVLKSTHRARLSAWSAGREGHGR